MGRISLLIGGVLLGAGLGACVESDKPANTSVSARSFPQAESSTAEDLLALALERGKAYEILTRLCTAAPHRLAGSPGADVAVEWGVR